MKPAAHIAKSVSTTKTGLFATLGGLFHVKGTGASKASGGTGLFSVRRPGRTFRPYTRTKCCVPVLLGAVIGMFAFTAAPALAAGPPESPLTTAPAEIKGSTAVLEGVVNPLKTATTSWFFEYKAGAVCSGGSITPTEGPEETEARPVEARVEGLTQDTEYTVCLVAENEAEEKTVGTPETFTTITPEPPAGLEANLVTGTSAMLHGVLNPNHAGEAGTYEFLYRPSVTECHYVIPRAEEERLQEEIREGGRIAKATAEAELKQLSEKVAENNATPSTVATGHEDEAVSALVSRLLPGTEYTFCLSATNASGESATSAPDTFTTTAVGQENSPTVTAGEAEVDAEIGTDGETTTYRVQYGTSSVAESSTPEASIPAAGKPVVVEQRLGDLKAGTTYRFRFVANNGHGIAYGGERTFTTPAPAETSPSEAACKEKYPTQPPRTAQSASLAECRAYELVSPVDTEGQDATGTVIATAPRASAGVEGTEAITYASRGVFSGAHSEPEGGNVENQYLSRRGLNGWITQPITPLRDPIKAESSPSYASALFTPELTAAVASTTAPLGGSARSAGVFNLYVVDLEHDTYDDIGGGGEEVPGEGETHPLGASEDLSHVVFGDAGEIFEWIDGKVVQVNRANNPEATSLSGSVGAVPHYGGEEDMWHAVSANGSRVFFSTPTLEETEGPSGLYVRVNAEQPQSKVEVKGTEELCTEPTQACTIEVSASQRTTPDEHGPQRPRYWGASADGSKVFFTDCSKLTNESTAVSSEGCGHSEGFPIKHVLTGNDLYEYDVETGALKDLTVDMRTRESTGDPLGANVQGVVQISENGSYVYFVATGELAKGEGVDGQPNLYVSHEGGAPKFIATLASNDEPTWNNGYYEGTAGPDENSADVSPSGAQIAFVSEAKIDTEDFPNGYDNQQSATGECERAISSVSEVLHEHGACDEVYLYDAGFDSHPPTLTCASCNPTGARPIGPADLGPITYRTRPYEQYRSRNLLEDGDLFFDSRDALTPHAVSGQENVYEYADGRVNAISDPTEGHESFFLDASANGDNVFFASADQLVAQDKGENVAVYDARIGGGFPVPAESAPCENGDSCKPPPTAQPSIYGAPASATFSGSGNPTPAVPAVVTPKKKTAAELRAEKLTKALKTCRTKKNKQKRRACEKQARSKYGIEKKKVKKSNHGKGSK